MIRFLARAMGYWLLVSMVMFLAYFFAVTT
jgi:hypothetical protein